MYCAVGVTKYSCPDNQPMYVIQTIMCAKCNHSCLRLLTLFNPVISPPGSFFISDTFEGELNRDGGLFEGQGQFLIKQRRWYQFSKKNQNTISGKAQVQEVGGHAGQDKKQI